MYYKLWSKSRGNLHLVSGFSRFFHAIEQKIFCQGQLCKNSPIIYVFFSVIFTLISAYVSRKIVSCKYIVIYLRTLRKNWSSSQNER